MDAYEAWYVCDLEWSTGNTMSYATDIIAINFGTNENYSGNSSNFMGGDLGNGQGEVENFYAGIANNYLALDVSTNISNITKDQDYFGVNNNYNTILADSTQSKQMDNNPILLHPKDQKIYYKVAGYNPNTSSYETWIISEQIVPRPELFDSNQNPPPVLFDPNGNPPNVDLGIFYTPPSGNPLVDIKIVGRWIQ